MTVSPAANKPHRPRLMIAEDDVDDQMLMRDALEQNGLRSSDFAFANDGQELMGMLNASSDTPAIILMDLNMPRKDGREALKEIKATENYRHIPVIVFTTSSDDDDIRLTYQCGGNSFFTKPASYDGLVDVFALIKKYWMETAVLTA